LRVFLVGTKLAVDEALGRTFARPRSLLPESLRSALLANLDLHWFCADLPQPPPLLTAGLADIVERLDQRDSRWWSEAEVQRHLAMMSESHRQIVFDLQASPNVGYRTFYRRVRNDKQRAEVRSDEVAGCLRTAVGGSGKQFLVAAGNGSVRMRTMTPREYARLQGVPDSYPITVTDIQALTGFGDAVCVPVISWVARYALNPLVEQYLPGVRLYQDAPCLTT
jgi:DNA (cytosine-5)-methyltransferase 1